MKNSAINLQYLDIVSFHPSIIFVKSKAMFKIKFKDQQGSFHYFYFDFLPIRTKIAAVNELLSISYLTNSFLNHLPTKNPHYSPIPIKLP